MRVARFNTYIKSLMARFKTLFDLSRVHLAANDADVR